jgi:ribosomal protein S18 acetylase RimI-like enzyme
VDTPPELKIIAEPYPRSEWKETVVRGVDQHNVAVTGLPDYYPVGSLITGQGGEILGGLQGEIWGGWLHVMHLWISAALRGRGYGDALMAHAHRYALQKSCTHAFLRTGSYEARAFYEKLGYSVYAELKNHPVAPHLRYFMSRRLEAGREPTPLKTDLPIAMNPYLSQEAENAIRIGIASHAHAAIGLPETEWSPHNYFLRDASGEIMGGVLGNLWSEWFYVDYVWVDRTARGKGHASRLMAAAEQGAMTRGCTNAFLGTFSFQARPLYEKLGYRVFGELKEYPKGHSHFHLTKRLAR